MKIVILQGSPNLKGSTAILVEEFARGAREAGHEVERIDVARSDVRPCTGCVACGYGARPCTQRDGMASVLEKLLAADMVVFATPVYYFGMTAQLKAVVDRFCSENVRITAKRLKAALLAVAWNGDAETFAPLEVHYDAICRYLDLRDCGRVIGRGCGTPSMTRASDYPHAAYELGRSL